MCGRFAQFSIKDFLGIQEEFDVREKDIPDDLPFNYNVSPGQPVVAIVDEEIRKLKAFQWGLITNWSAKKTEYKLTNVRAETLLEKKTFDAYFRQKRCLVIADGFYEWKKAEQGKVPYYIYQNGGKPFAIAGLWNVWDNPEGKTIPSCTLITTVANTLVSAIHDRMPVIVPREKWNLWLNNREFDRDQLTGLLEPYPPDRMAMHEVSNEVNNPRNNRPGLIDPVVKNVLF
jgi:putative SOS response-associated peptidase YedK